jgi:hypothetical protein
MQCGVNLEDVERLLVIAVSALYDNEQAEGDDALAELSEEALHHAWAALDNVRKCKNLGRTFSHERLELLRFA